MINLIQLEEQIDDQMVKQIKVLTRIRMKKMSKLLILGKIKSMEESRQIVAHPSIGFPLKENHSLGNEGSKTQEPHANIQVSLEELIPINQLKQFILEASLGVKMKVVFYLLIIMLSLIDKELSNWESL